MMIGVCGTGEKGEVNGMDGWIPTVIELRADEYDLDSARWMHMMRDD